MEEWPSTKMYITSTGPFSEELCKTTSYHNTYNSEGYSYVWPGDMIEHIGPPSTLGHYVSHILNNKRWFKMDDSLVGYTSDDNKIQLLQVMDIMILNKSRPIY